MFETAIVESKKLFEQYIEHVRDLLRNPGARHPTKEVWIHMVVSGRRTLKYDLLMSIATIHDISTKDMLKRIFERGLDKEFEYWSSNHTKTRKEHYELPDD